jgi:hypothetical protein
MAKNSTVSSDFSASFSSGKDSSNGITLEEYSPPQDSSLYSSDPQVKYVDVYYEHPYEIQFLDCIGTEIGAASKIENSVVNFQEEDQSSVSTIGLESVTTYQKIGTWYVIKGTSFYVAPPFSVSFSKNRFILSPTANYVGLLSYQARCVGKRYKVFLTGKLDGEWHGIVTANSFYTDTSQNKILVGSSYVELTGSSSTSSADKRNDLSISEYSPPEGNPLKTLDVNIKYVDVYCNHAFSMDSSDERIVLTSAGDAILENTTYQTFSNTNLVSITSPGIAGLPSIKTILAYDTNGNPVDLKFVWNSDLESFQSTSSGSYYGVVEVSYTQKGKRYRVDMTDVPQVNVTKEDGSISIESSVILSARSFWKSPADNQVYVGFGTVTLTNVLGANKQVSNILQVEVFEISDIAYDLPKTVKFVDVYAEHPYTVNMMRSPLTGIGEARKEVVTEISINASDNVSLSAPGMRTSPTITLLELYDAAGQSVRLGSDRVGWSYDPHSQKIKISPAGKYYAFFKVEYTQVGERYQTDLVSCFLYTKKKVDGYSYHYEDYCSAKSIFIDPETKQVVPAFVVTKISATVELNYSFQNQIQVEGYTKPLGPTDSPEDPTKKYFDVYSSVGHRLSGIGLTIQSAGEATKVVDTFASVSGSNVLAVGVPGIQGTPSVEIVEMYDESGNSVSPGWTYNDTTKNIQFSGDATSKYYGVLKLGYTAVGDRIAVRLGSQSKTIDTEAGGEKTQYYGTLIARSFYFHPVTGKPYPAFSVTQVSADVEEAFGYDDHDPGTFNFKFEEASDDPEDSMDGRYLTHFIKVFPCPSEGGGEGLPPYASGDNSFSDVQGFIYAGDDKHYTDLPGINTYRKTLEVKKSVSVINSDSVTLDYFPEGSVSASILGQSRDYFGASMEVEVAKPGDEIYGGSWRKDFVRKHMYLDQTATVSKRRVNFNEIVFCVRRNTIDNPGSENSSVSEKLVAIPVSCSVQLQYTASYSNLAVTFHTDPSNSGGATGINDANRLVDGSQFMTLIGSWSGGADGKTRVGAGTWSCSKKATKKSSVIKGPTMTPSKKP